MKFSVLMSVYKNDDAVFLKLALESIYEKQTLRPDEIVLVFDGPLTEALYAAVDAFVADKADVVRLIKLEKNGGLGNALKVGSEQCMNDYIIRMDSDDISDVHRFEKQIAYVESHPEIDCVGTYIAEFNETPNENMRVRIVPEEHTDIVEMGKMRNPMNHVSVCIKKEALVKCGGYETLLLLEDYYLWLKMIAAGCKLANIPETLVYVRVGNGFNYKRGSKVRIKGWQKLQSYMLDHKMINRVEATINMAYITGFTYCPNSLRKFVYDKLLRR